jgi:hypothetical protein
MPEDSLWRAGPLYGEGGGGTALEGGGAAREPRRLPEGGEGGGELLEVRGGGGEGPSLFRPVFRKRERCKIYILRSSNSKQIYRLNNYKQSLSEK